MYEYKSEVLSINKEHKGIKFVKTVIDNLDKDKLDELINARAAEGWELVTHSSLVDNALGRVSTIVTFRRPRS